MKETHRDAVASEVARILREERVARDLSMTTVGERAGLAHQMISFVEREMRSPSLDTMLRISEALEIRLSDVLRKAETAVKKQKSLKPAKWR